MGLLPQLNHSKLTTKTVGPTDLPPFKGLEVTPDSMEALPKVSTPFPFSVESPNQDFFFLEDVSQACPMFHKHLVYDNPLELIRLDSAAVDLIQTLDSQGISS